MPLSLHRFAGRRMLSTRNPWRLPSLVLAFALTVSQPSAADIEAFPSRVVLDRPEATQQLLIRRCRPEGDLADRTRDVDIAVLDPQIVTVTARGVVVPVTEGRTTLLVTSGNDRIQIPVEVRGLTNPPPLSFEHEIIPVLTKVRCNSGGCHGKAEGQNGFKLSVFGFDPAADHASLTQESRGRRLNLFDPPRSPLLLKATATVPHGGGRKIDVDSLHYRRLSRWVAEGAQLTSATAPVVAIQIEPGSRIMHAGETQQIQVTALAADGARHCVTAEAEYESSTEPIAQVDSRGLITVGTVPGEATILVRYLDQVAVCRVTHPQRDVAFSRPPEVNFIDGHVWNKLAQLGVQPSELADDATFLRRVFLDTIGTLPSPAEAREFLQSTATEKREQLIERLLQRDEYADYWAMRWADLLRVDQDRTQPEGAVAMTRWLRRQFAINRPYDQFARDILTARGSTQAEGPAALFKVLDTPESLSRSLSQLFLGVRIECAQCHHHPFEHWSQDDYLGLAGFFTGVGTKTLPGGASAIVVKPGNDLVHPRTGSLVATRALAAPPADCSPGVDRREVLADWMTSVDNPFFRRVIANRLWSHYFGRGLVEPIDDLRATNPATNEPLLTALADHFHEVKYDLKAFTRTLLNSRTYQLTWGTNSSNAADDQNFSHARDKALPAEVLLDAISQATGVPEKFQGWPEGYRAIQIWDNRLPSYFLRIFGRPLRTSVCECERSNEPSISQALHLMNSGEILGRIESADGRARRLADSSVTAEQIVEELYLATLSRFPRAEERRLLLTEFERSERRIAAEDALWALLNSKEFLYNR